jgi:putative tryptophan/tyrosine transport system substrate-binding protein
MSTRMARTANRRCERLHSLTLFDFFVLTANRLENASRFELSFREENVRKGSQLGHCLVSTTASPPASESAQSLLRCARFEADHHLLSFREVCMTRRDFIILLGAAVFVLPRDSVAQASARTYRLGTLTGNVALSVNSPDGATLLNAMGQRGYTLGKNLAYDARGAGGELSKIPQLIQDFTASGVDVILTVGYPSARHAKLAGIPTVIAYGAGDPVATGLVNSLAQPGGTVTGISDNAALLSTKRLSLLKTLSPRIRRVAMLWNRNDLGMSLRYQASANAAQELGVTVQALGVQEPDDFDDAFAAMDRYPPDAILMVSDSLTTLNRKRVFDYAAAKRLPAIYEYDQLVRDGGLMSYGPDLNECFERAAAMVDRIFKGAKPSELPFEQPTHYRFMINLITAKAIGVEIPLTLLAFADEVIE